MSTGTTITDTALTAATFLPQTFPGPTREPAPDIKCRWCQWTCPRWVGREGGGSPKSGYDLLRNHCTSWHAHEMRAIQEAENELEAVEDEQRQRERWSSD